MPTCACCVTLLQPIDRVRHPDAIIDDPLMADARRRAAAILDTMPVRLRLLALLLAGVVSGRRKPYGGKARATPVPGAGARARARETPFSRF